MTAPNPAPGEPVTNAEQFTPDPADVELVADALARRYCWDGIDELTAVAPANAEYFRYNAEAVVSALAAAGRLLPPDADTRPAGRCTAPVGAHQHSGSCGVPVPTTPTEV